MVENRDVLDRGDELLRLDHDAAKARASADEAEIASMRLFVSLVVDQMADAAEHWGAGGLDGVLPIYFGSARVRFMADKRSYFGQVKDRVGPHNQDLEPFKTCFNDELESRGSIYRLDVVAPGWNGAILVSA